MPYRRKYRSTYRRKRSYRRRAPVDRSPTVAQTASAAWKMGKIAMSILNSEKKHYDETNTQTPTTSGVVVSLIRGMSQGDTNNTYEGNSFLAKSILLRGAVTLNASATTTRTRIMVVQDTRPQSSVPAVTDILSSASVLAPLNIDNQLNRFIVLMDKNFVVSNVAGNPPSITWKRFIKKSFHVKMDDSAVPVLNDVVILYLSDEATNAPSITTITRLRFYDN